MRASICAARSPSASMAERIRAQRSTASYVSICAALLRPFVCCRITRCSRAAASSPAWSATCAAAYDSLAEASRLRSTARALSSEFCASFNPSSASASSAAHAAAVARISRERPIRSSRSSLARSSPLAAPMEPPICEPQIAPKGPAKRPPRTAPAAAPLAPSPSFMATAVVHAAAHAAGRRPAGAWAMMAAHGTKLKRQSIPRGERYRKDSSLGATTDPEVRDESRPMLWRTPNVQPYQRCGGRPPRCSGVPANGLK
mmetsp:Transcript_60234/g.138188  ORF Transcript_60234/g.138188 Transcript_60234/m.138188 type:complete len:258 (-) Transcript_60234:67-840(-)